MVVKVRPRRSNSPMVELCSPDKSEHRSQHIRASASGPQSSALRGLYFAGLSFCAESLLPDAGEGDSDSGQLEWVGWGIGPVPPARSNLGVGADTFGPSALKRERRIERRVGWYIRYLRNH